MNELLAYFQRELPVINGFIEAETDKFNGLVRDVAKHVLIGPGKRIRPVLTICTARALGHEGADPMPLACALEMLHSATLLHDDVLDDADLRRGKAAAHTIFGTNETILAGDVLLALSNRLGAQYGKPRLSWLLAEGIMHTADGEIMEIAALKDPDLERSTYLDIIIGKTARLIETACRCGAVLATDDPAAEEAAGEYGLNLGIAFQLVDDALDYVSPSDTTGKPEGGDLREGKITLPLIFLLEDMARDEARALLAKMRSGGLDEASRKQVLDAVREKGFAERTRDEAAAYIEKAKGALAPLPDSEEKVVLEQAADFVLTRKK